MFIIHFLYGDFNMGFDKSEQCLLVIQIKLVLVKYFYSFIINIVKNPAI